MTPPAKFELPPLNQPFLFSDDPLHLKLPSFQLNPPVAIWDPTLPLVFPPTDQFLRWDGKQLQWDVPNRFQLSPYFQAPKFWGGKDAKPPLTYPYTFGSNPYLGQNQQPDLSFKPFDPKQLTINAEGWDSKAWLELHGIKENPTEKWVNFLQQLFNNVDSLDIDFVNLPVNRGLGLSRFSEFAPKTEADRKPPILVKEGTVGRAHGEIRPIKGMNQSWITRVTQDFTPNVHYIDTKNNILPDLEIDGFTAVDPPTMTYDFKKGRDAVLSISGGDYSWENPLFNGSSLSTKFGTEVDPPESGHDYWMFRFMPIATSGLKLLMEKTADGDTALKMGRGGLLLWAYLPTAGILGAERYKDLKIPYNTFPRRFGDLVKLLEPLFDSDFENYRQAAPYYNPNNEYMAPYVDKDGMLLPMPAKWRDIIDINDTRKKECRESKKAGKPNCLPLVGRQPLPDDPKEAGKLDDFLVKLGVTRVPRKRGSIIDWIFTDIVKDPTRLKAMSAFPYATLHMKMRATTLDTPVGKITVDPSTDIKVNYTVTPVTNPKTKQTEARMGLSVEITPLSLAGVDLEMGAFNVKAKTLKAKKVIFTLPSIPGMSTEDPSNRPPWLVTVEGVEADTLKVDDAQKNFDIDMAKANIEKLNFTYSEDWKESTLGELKAANPAFDTEKCLYQTKEGKEKYACSVASENGVWKNYAPMDYQGADALPESTRIVYNAGGSWKLGVEKLGGTGLVVDSKFGKLNINEFDIPKLDVAVTLEGREKTGDKGPYRKDEIRFITVTVPEIKSKIGLEVSNKENATSVKLDGSASLKNLKFFSDNEGNETISDFSVDLSGSINSASLANPIFGSATFTTMEDPEHVHAISGSLKTHSTKSNTDPTAKPKATFDLDLDLPYVGFSTTGVFVIPEKSSTLSKTHLKLSSNPSLNLSIDGHIDLKNASHQGTEPFSSPDGRISLLPNLSNFNLAGDFAFTFSPEGFSLKPATGSSDLLHLNFDLDGSKFHIMPDVSKQVGGNLPESNVIQTDIALKSTKVRVENLKEIEVKRVEVNGEKKNVPYKVDAGPITIHQIEGSGSIWVNLVIWGFVRGLFPTMGGSGGTSGATVKRPDPARLTDHMAAEDKKKLRAILGSGDFIHLGKINLDGSSGAMKINLSEILMNLHEDGGRGQFGQIRLPELNIGGGSLLGKGGFLLDIFLNDPERGGYFHIHR